MSNERYDWNCAKERNKKNRWWIHLHNLRTENYIFFNSKGNWLFNVIANFYSKKAQLPAAWVHGVNGQKLRHCASGMTEGRAEHLWQERCKWRQYSRTACHHRVWSCDALQTAYHSQPCAWMCPEEQKGTFWGLHSKKNKDSGQFSNTWGLKLENSTRFSHYIYCMSQ